MDAFYPGVFYGPFLAKTTQLAHNVLRTICYIELGERVVVLWLFCIQPSHNVLGIVQDTQLAHNVLRTICVLGFLLVSS